MILKFDFLEVSGEVMIYVHKKKRRSQEDFDAGVIPEGFEPPIFWAVTRGIIQLCYGTKPFVTLGVFSDCDAKIGVFFVRCISCRLFFLKIFIRGLRIGSIWG